MVFRHAQRKHKWLLPAEIDDAFQVIQHRVTEIEFDFHWETKELVLEQLKDFRIIGFIGKSGAGKSHLMNSISKVLNMKTVRVDCTGLDRAAQVSGRTSDITASLDTKCLYILEETGTGSY